MLNRRTLLATAALLAAAPLVQANDAHLLDTSEMTIEAAFREALAIVERARGS